MFWIWTFLGADLDPGTGILADPDPDRSRWWFQWIGLKILTNLLFWSLKICPLCYQIIGKAPALNPVPWPKMVRWPVNNHWQPQFSLASTQWLAESHTANVTPPCQHWRQGCLGEPPSLDVSTRPTYGEGAFPRPLGRCCGPGLLYPQEELDFAWSLGDVDLPRSSCPAPLPPPLPCPVTCWSGIIQYSRRRS